MSHFMVSPEVWPGGPLLQGTTRPHLWPVFVLRKNPVPDGWNRRYRAGQPGGWWRLGTQVHEELGHDVDRFEGLLLSQKAFLSARVNQITKFVEHPVSTACCIKTDRS